MFWLDAQRTPAGGAAAPNLASTGPALDARYGSTSGVDVTDPVLLTHTGTNYLYLPGATNNYASTPDAASLDVVGDLEIVIRASLDSFSAQQGFISKSAGATLGGYEFFLNATGFLTFRWDNGTATTSAFPTNSVGAAGLLTGTTYWFKTTIDVDNGAGGHQVNFFWAADSNSEPSVWNAFVQPTVGVGVTSIGNSATQMGIGAYYNGGANPMAGRFYRAIVRNGIAGSAVLDADFTTGITSGSQVTFTESSANAATVTINRSTSGRKSVAVTRPVWLFGTDDFMEAAANPFDTYVETTTANTSGLSTTYVQFDTGTATAGGASTLDDTTKTWTTGAFSSRVVRITGGTGNGQVRVIASNTVTQLTVTPAWTTTPDATSTYVVESRGNVEGDIQIIVRCALNVWSGTALAQPLVNKRETQYSWNLYITPTGQISLGYSLDGTTFLVNSSTVAPFVDGQTYWVRCRRTASTGAYQFDYALDQTTEPTLWTSISSGTGTAGLIWKGNANIAIAKGTVAGTYTAGRFYNVKVTDGFAGNAVVYWLAQGHPASGNYVNANRVLWTLGANATVVNPNPLNFGANDSYTVVSVQRTWTSPVASGTIASKWSGGGGYNVRNGFGTPSQPLIALNDNTTSQAVANSVTTLGAATVLAWVVQPTQVTPYMDNTTFAPVARTVFEGSASEVAFRLGSTPAGSAFNDFELLAAAVIPKALTAAEIAQVVTFYN